MQLPRVRAGARRFVFTLVTACAVSCTSPLYAADDVLSLDSFVPHKSTVPANAGQPVGMHLRERVLESVKRSAAAGKAPKVVLFVHGGFSPATGTWAR